MFEYGGFLGEGKSVLIWVIVALVALFLIAFIRNYIKVPPNVALIVSGRRRKYKVKDEAGREIVKEFGYRIVRGGATFVIPFFERVDKAGHKVTSLPWPCRCSKAICVKSSAA